MEDMKTTKVLTMRMKTTMTKGSPQALAWGKKMQSIRAAGLRMEKKFFGRRGVFAKAGHTKHLKKNPITLVGNPPKSITANIAGILYRRVVEVRAEKTGTFQKGFWYHPFKAGSDVQMLALDTGDILLHSTAGKKLWREA